VAGALSNNNNAAKRGDRPVQRDLILLQAARVRGQSLKKRHVVESNSSFLNASRKTFCGYAPLYSSRVSWYVVVECAAAAAALIDGLCCKQRQGCGCSNCVLHEIAAAGAQASAASNWLTLSSIRGVLRDTR
jgi:predicted nucleic-acid-binding Zn-ribbon protein